MWNEQEHPRDKNGQFVSRNAGNALTKEEAQKMSAGELKERLATKQREEEITIKLPDIQLPRSIGAKWINETVVDFATGKQYHFVEGSKLQNVEFFCGCGTKKAYNNAYKYADKFGGAPEEWQHAKAIGELKTDKGIEKAEIHWSQHPKFGKKEFFIKLWLD